MAEVNVLDVLLYGEPIGTLTRAGERTIFAFTEAYIENESRPVLSLGFKDEFGELITEHKPSRIKLPPFFSNLLPEGHMRSVVAEIVERFCFSLYRTLTQPLQRLVWPGSSFG